MSLYFMEQNTGKRNISIDLNDPDGVELVLQLVERCDVLVENYRPGVMDAFGLSYAEVAERNPRLIYGSISGYGHENPWSHRKAFAPLIHAESGITHLRTRRFGPERPFEVSSYADTYVGLECLIGVLAALHARGLTGRGQHVDVDMTSTMLCINDRTAGELAFDLEDKEDLEACVSAITSEGRQVVIVGDPTTRSVFACYVEAMARPDLAEDPRFVDGRARRRHRHELVRLIEDWVATFDDIDRLDRHLAAHRIPMGVVRTIPEIADSEWALARKVFAEVDDRVGGSARIPEAPWRFSDTASGLVPTISYPGEDNRTVLAEVLGLTDSRLAELEHRGVLRSRVPE